MIPCARCCWDSCRQLPLDAFIPMDWCSSLCADRLFGLRLLEQIQVNLQPQLIRTERASRGKAIPQDLDWRVGRLDLRAHDLGRRLSTWRFAKRIHRNRRILDVDDLEMFRLC